MLNWLIVGTGDIVQKRIIGALEREERSRIAGICSTTTERAGELTDRCGARPYYHLTEALGSNDIDAVYIATPVFLHVPQAIQALKAKKHVLVEKPLALSFPQAQELVKAAQESGTRCGAAYYRRLYPRFQMVREMLAKKEFGQLILIRTNFRSWFNPDKGSPRYWHVIPEKSGGGPLADMGSHMLDMIIGLIGLPATVLTKTATLTHSYAVEDSAAVIMTYENGPLVTAGFHWNSRTRAHDFEIVGTEAGIKWDRYDEKTIIKTVGNRSREINSPIHENVHFPLIEDFVSAVIENREPAVTAAEAAATNRLLDAAYLSAREGREVRIEEIKE